MHTLSRSDIIDDGRAVALTWPDGTVARFHAVWLRDNALDPETRAPSNGQRLITVLDIPADVRIEAARVEPSGELWLRFAPGAKEVTFPATWLAERIYDAPHDRTPGWIAPDLECWDRSFDGRLARIAHADAVQDRAALCHWLAAVRRHGLAVMTGVPCEDGAVCGVAELFGHVRETNYGRLFDVRSEVDPVNLAYTNLGLQAHTDNPYRDPVPTLQLLACLQNSVDGGESILLDGFNAATRLRAEAPDAFALLTRHCARFEYAGAKGVRLRARRPMIELAPDGALLAVRFNSRSAAPFLDIPYAEMAAYYDAYRRFAEIIERPELAIEFKMGPGDLILFDNTRVLHARTAFSGAGARWLQGCYADKDGLLSTLDAFESEAGAAQAAE